MAVMSVVQVVAVCARPEVFSAGVIVGKKASGPPVKGAGKT